MSRKDLFNKLWKASNILRRDDGTNGINEYIEQISWMFFLKVFEDIEKRFEGESILEGKKYLRIIPMKHSWSYWTKKDTKDIIDYIDTELIPFLVNLSGSPEKNTISTIFKEIRHNKMKSASNLKDVIDIINEIDFNDSEDSHTLSIFYESLLIKLGKESGIAGEFYTPRPIIKLIVSMIDPKFNVPEENIKILDPFCGSCGFLIESFKKIMNSGKISSKDLLIIQRDTFHGYEKKSLPFLVGLMNCILHGLLTPNVLRRNSLNDNVLKFGPDDKADYILTNPPFGGIEGKQIQQNFPIKVQATELLALQQVMRRLKSNGKCGIVVPDGLLSRIDSSFSKAKEELLENYNVHTIISLPSGVFANVTSAGNGPKTSIVLFDKNKKTEKIWYYELTPPEGTTYSRTNTIESEHLKDCFTKWKNKIISENSWFVEVQDIVKRNYDLSAINPVEHMHRKDKKLGPNGIVFSSFLKEVKDKIVIEDDKEYKQITVQLHGRGAILRKTILGKDIKTKSQYVARTNNLIVSKIDARNGALAIVPPELDGAVVTADFPLFKINDKKIDIEFLEVIIRHGDFERMLSSISKGTTNRRRIKSDDILNLNIHLPAKTDPNQIVAKIKNNNLKLEKMKNEINKIESDTQRIIKKECVLTYEKID